MRPIVHTALTPEAARVVSMSQPRSPWHSPVPYLFGGLAAMLGLIAFALLILACSYWRLSTDETQQQQQSNEGNDLENGGKLDGLSKMNDPPVFEEKIVVIMAGNEKPTFIATPALMFKYNSDNHHQDDRNVAKDDHEEDEEKSKDDHQHPHS
ncbi:unnamed protein product [Amaranthus hypochondriacus]